MLAPPGVREPRLVYKRHNKKQLGGHCNWTILLYRDDKRIILVGHLLESEEKAELEVDACSLARSRNC